jgi:hypothetical protein
MIVLTQMRIHPPARDYIARRRNDGKTNREAMRALKRHLVRTIYRLLHTVADRTPLQANSALMTPCVT